MSDDQNQEEILNLMDDDPVFNDTNCYWKINTESINNEILNQTFDPTSADVSYRKIYHKLEHVKYQVNRLFALVDRARVTSNEEELLWATLILKKDKGSLLAQTFTDVKHPWKSVFIITKNILIGTLDLALTFTCSPFLK